MGLPSTASLTSGGRDLDNFAFPVATRLGPARVAAFFTSKVAGGQSSVAAGPAQPAGDLAGGWGFFSASATASATTKAWKDQVAAQVPTVETGDTPLELEIGFIVGPGRNWAALWKPAIDSLGGILGVKNPARPYFPKDDRIVRLGLHRTVDPTVGWAVHLGVRWRVADDSEHVPPPPAGG